MLMQRRRSISCIKRMTTLAEEFLRDIGSGHTTKEKIIDPQDVQMQEELGSILEGDELKSLHSRVMNAYAEEKEYQLHNEKGDRKPKHELIVEANDMCMVLVREIHKIHQVLLELYSRRFPELSQLVPLPLDYAKVVKLIQDDTAKVNSEELSDILPQSTVISISMIASSTSGLSLGETELEKVMDACEKMIKVEEVRAEIFEYVESQMKYYAPNLTALVGPEVAANLIGAAGGLQNLAEMPAGNLKVIGKKKQVLDGFSSMHAAVHV
eukprot:TRINITY_DN3869_c0_g1_i3.p1 TRINITY_DN3869_c0_g1~~TRINITY_DN3869_c0_g1_i3.p1  ORF type:complete len:268 (+),score=64.61 TRINITY_DN3869_c0_g1_i3:34-837(+)